MGITMHRARQCEMAQKMSAKVDTTVNTGQTVVQLQFSFVRGCTVMESPSKWVCPKTHQPDQQCKC